jgi:hypothetical protein
MVGLYLRSSRKAMVAGGKRLRGKGGGDEVREMERGQQCRSI